MSAGFKILDGSDWRDFCLITQESVTIGRDGATFIIENDVVSRKHVRIFKHNDDFFCLDLNSTNGSKINNVTLEPFYPFNLIDGDILLLATVPLKFFKNYNKSLQFNVFIFDEQLNLCERREFVDSCTINLYGVVSVKVLDKSRFLVECEEKSRVILTAECEIVRTNQYSVTSPGCIRVNEYIISLSGPREEEQQTSETLLPAIITQSYRPMVDRGTVVVEYKYQVDPKHFVRRADSLKKYSGPNFLTTEIILWIIIILMAASTVFLIFIYLL